MLKSLKGHSPAGVALFCLTCLAGLFFRIYRLEEISAWNEEVSSLYFASNLDRVFFHHNQTPFYSILSRLWFSIAPTSVNSLRYFSVVLSTLVSGLAAGLLWKRKGSDLAVFLFILIWLSPLGILFSRQAGPWALTLDLTFLIVFLWSYRDQVAKTGLWFLWTAYQLLHPLALVVTCLLILTGLSRKKTSGHEAKFFLTTSFIPVGYHLLRFIFMGKNFLGPLYPHSQPIPPWFPLAGQVVFGMAVIIGLFYVLKKSHLYVAVAICLILTRANFEFLSYTKNASWDDQHVARFKKLQGTLKPKELVICASAPQLDYYFDHTYMACSTEVLRLHLKRQGFYLYSIGGDDDLLISFLRKSTRIEREIRIGHGLLLSIKYAPRK